MSSVEKPANLVIPYDPQNVESLRQGLKLYRQYIQREESFHEFYCHVTFKVEENGDDAIGNLLQDSITRTLIRYVGARLEEIKPETNLGDCVYEEETAFFLRALNYAELESELEQTAITLTALSRRINDSSEMWISDTEVLGLLPLFMLALKYPQYTYHLASYIVPYWDEEHAPFGGEVLAIVVSHHGYNHHMLKAFCYCDNYMARAKMFTLEAMRRINIQEVQGKQRLQPLLEIFRQKPGEFELFKRLLKERYAAMDFLQYTSDPHEYNDDPIRSFVLSIVSPDLGTEWYDFDDKEESMSEAMFIGSVADDAAADLKIEIEEYLGRAIVEPKEYEEKEYSDIYYSRGTSEEQWKAFICEEFENGQQVWDYVLTGEQPEILDQIEACDAPKLMTDGNYKIAEKIDYYVGMFETFHSELASILNDVICDWRPDDEGDEYDECPRLLRLLDVMHRWNAKESFHADLIDQMVNEYKFISDKAFLRRYNGDWKILLYHCIDSFSGYSSNIALAEAQMVYQVSLDNRDELKNIIENEDYPQVSDEFRVGPQRETILAMCAAIVYFDRENDTKDDLNQYLLSLLDQQLVRALMDQMSETSHFVCGSKTPSWQYIEPEEEVLKQINQDWGVVEQYLNVQHDDVVQATICFDKQQKLDDDDDSLFFQQKRYRFLRDFDRRAQKLLVAAHVVSKQKNSPIKDFCERFVELWVRIAPCKTCRMLGHFYNVSRYGDFESEEFMRQNAALTDKIVGITDVGATAFVTENLISEVRSGEDYQEVLQPMFEVYKQETQTDEPEQQLLHLSLSLIPPRYKQIFMGQLHKYGPAIDPDYFETELRRIVQLRVKQRILNTIHEDRDFNDEERTALKLIEDYAHLKQPATQAQIEELVTMMESRYIEDFNGPYQAAEVDFLFWFASDVLKDNLLQVYIHHSEMSFTKLHDSDDESQKRWLCERALSLGMRRIKLFESIIDHHWEECLDIFPDQLELASLTNELSVENLYDLLVELAKRINYQLLIESHAEHRSRRIRDLVRDIQSGKYTKNEFDLIELINFGIYAEAGSDGEIEAAKQAQQEDEEGFVATHKLEHRKETLLVEAKVGLTIGMRVGYFEDDRPKEELPETITLNARVHHPYINTHDGYLSEWDLQLEVDTSCYIGWTFSHKSLCVPGMYKVEMLDCNGNVVESKTFHVVQSKPFLTDHLIEKYQDGSLTQEHVGSMNVHDSALNIIDVIDNCGSLNIANRLPNNVVHVYQHYDNNELVFLEFRLNENTPKHWYRAANQLRPYIEKRVKGKQLLIGSNIAIENALSNFSLWQTALSVESPIQFIRPDSEHADSIIALHVEKKAFRTLFGYSKEGELCRIIIVPLRVGMLHRFLLHMITKIARQVSENHGVPNAI